MAHIDSRPRQQQPADIFRSPAKARCARLRSRAQRFACAKAEMVLVTPELPLAPFMPQALHLWQRFYPFQRLAGTPAHLPLGFKLPPTFDAARELWGFKQRINQERKMTNATP